MTAITMTPVAPLPTSAALPAVRESAAATVKQLFAFLEAQGHGDYLGEAVSQLEHSLQCAYSAVEAKADHETIIGALLHDVGRFIPQADKMPVMIAPDGKMVGRASHEVLGERYLGQLGFSDKVCQLVGAHVMAKRYLTAVVDGYWESLSPSSKTTLKYQGGVFTEEQVKQAQKDPWLNQKLAVRRWDDDAKVAGKVVPGLESYQDIAIECLLDSRSSFTLHSRTYSLPVRPTVAICVDGFDPEYLAHGISDGILPNLAKMVSSAFQTTAKVTMPSFTNPNNVSIITGVPTAIHGIAGNFYLDPKTREERMIKDDSLLRGSTILEQLSRRGVRVAAITAKDKLRQILSHGLNGDSSICFSAERADTCTQKVNGLSDVEAYVGRPAPPQYSGDLSLFVLDAGIKLLSENRADVFYLTLSDFIQHKHAPGSKESNEFMSALDDKVGQLIRLGAVVAVTGDHGMSDKSLPDGQPNVLFLQDELETRFGTGCARVICPITDPFVRHHGALGSFVRVHIAASHMEKREEMIRFAAGFASQVEIALGGAEAADRFELPLDREGDFVVVAKKNVVLGSRHEDHDLSALAGHRLRSHGGLSEESVPLLMSEPVREELESKVAQRQWRNFDIFDLLLNWTTRQK